MQKEKIFNLIKKILWSIIFAIFGFLFVVVIWLAIDKFIIGSPAPSFCGYSTLQIKSGSMSGTIEVGDIILIKDTKDYKIGDIIAFMHEGDSIPTTHRIVNYNPDNSFVTKGDYNYDIDDKAVSNDNIIGEVIHVFPKLGLFFDWLKLEGWIYIVSSVLIIYIGSLLIKILNPVNDDNEEENTEENIEEN